MSAPTNVPELLKSEWLPKLRTMIHSFRLHTEQDDLLQDLYVELLQKGYLARFDPTKAKFSTWLYIYVRNFLRKVYNHENCKAARHLAAAVRIDSTVDDTPLADFLAVRESPEGEEYPSLEPLTLYTAHSSNVYEGIDYPRDMVTAVRLLQEGNSVATIATKFATSPQFVYSLLRKAKSIYQATSKEPTISLLA